MLWQLYSYYEVTMTTILQLLDDNYAIVVTKTTAGKYNPRTL